jgi:anti-anti-sigma factor
VIDTADSYGAAHLRCMLEGHPRAAVLRVAGELDLGTAALFRGALDSLLSRDQSIIVDVQDLRYIDSKGVHILEQCREALGRQGRRLAVSSPAPTVRRVMEIAGLARMLSIYPDLPTALAAFGERD